MNVWSFEVKGNLKEVAEKLESALQPVDGFVLDINHDESNSLNFKVRKRILYAWYMVYQNWTIVKGSILKTETDNKTDVEISFAQHFLIKFIVFMHLFLGSALLIAILSGKSGGAYTFLLGGLPIALGILLWVGLQQKFKKDTKKYKTLISEILAS